MFFKDYESITCICVLHMMGKEEEGRHIIWNGNHHHHFLKNLLFVYLFSCSLSSFNYGVSPCKLYAQVGGNYYVVFHFINPNFLASSRPHFTILTLWLLDFIFISLVVLQLTSWPSIFCICRFAWLVQFVEGG